MRLHLATFQKTYDNRRRNIPEDVRDYTARHPRRCTRLHVTTSQKTFETIHRNISEDARYYTTHYPRRRTILHVATSQKTYETTRRNIPEGRHLHTRRREDLKFDISVCLIVRDLISASRDNSVRRLTAGWTTGLDSLYGAGFFCAQIGVQVHVGFLCKINVVWVSFIPKLMGVSTYRTCFR
jgi:hypothetical protein